MPRPQASVRGRLLALLLLAALPVVMLALAGTYIAYRDALQAARQALLVQRDLVVATLGARLATAEAMLRALPHALPVSGTACGDALQAATPAGLRLLVLEAGGKVRCDSAGASAASLPAIAPGSAALRPGNDFGLTLTRQTEDTPLRLVAVLDPVPMPPGLLVWLVDDEGSWPLDAAAAALSPPPRLAADGAGRVADGTRLIAVRGRLAEESGVLVARLAAPLREAALLDALRRLGEAVALLGLASVAVTLGAGYAVTRPLLRLRTAVATWRSQGTRFEVPDPAGLPDEIRDLAESFLAGAETLAARERELRAAMDRAEILAAEVHHRVKNNLQVVSSLLALQAQRVTDPAARLEFEAARDRIGALATLHRHMYVHHDPEAIDLQAFIAELGLQLFATIGDRPGRRIALDVDAPALRISSDQAVPLALIITEAVSAALKQGFPPDRGGRIGIRVEADERRARLTIEDDGVLPRQEDQLREMLMRGLARQLGGEMRREGAEIALAFPLRAPLPRAMPAVRPPAPGPASEPAPPAPSAPA